MAERVVLVVTGGLHRQMRHDRRTGYGGAVEPTPPPPTGAERAPIPRNRHDFWSGRECDSGGRGRSYERFRDPSPSPPAPCPSRASALPIDCVALEILPGPVPESKGAIAYNRLKCRARIRSSTLTSTTSQNR